MGASPSEASTEASEASASASSTMYSIVAVKTSFHDQQRQYKEGKLMTRDQYNILQY